MKMFLKAGERVVAESRTLRNLIKTQKVVVMMEKPAIEGGTEAIPSGLKNRFHFGLEEKDAADRLFEESIQSGNAFGYNGPEEEAFSHEFASFLGVRYADGVNSGTNAVFVALHALDLPPFSEVVVSPITDPGGIMPIVMLNCIPVVADAAPGCYNTDGEQIRKCITPLTRAIVIAHIGGEAADMDGIMSVAKEYGLPVIEDCAQSHGATWKGRYVGTCGTYGCFSLMFGKHFCTGGQGGAVVCNQEELYWKERRSADRGKPFHLTGMTNVIPAVNCNMDELHAAIGRAQLKKLPGIIKARQDFAEKLRKRGLGKLCSVSIPELPDGAKHSYWWWRLRFNGENMKCTKMRFCEALLAEGVSLNPDYSAAQPFAQEWFRECRKKHPWNNPLYTGHAGEADCPNAKQAVKEHFNLTIYESWGDAEADAIFHAFEKVTEYYKK